MFILISLLAANLALFFSNSKFSTKNIPFFPFKHSKNIPSLLSFPKNETAIQKKDTAPSAAGSSTFREKPCHFSGKVLPLFPESPAPFPGNSPAEFPGGGAKSGTVGSKKGTPLQSFCHLHAPASPAYPAFLGRKEKRFARNSYLCAQKSEHTPWKGPEQI